MTVEAEAETVEQPPTPPPPVQRILYSTSEVAELCGVATNTVSTWCKQGVIPSMRLGASGRGDYRIPAYAITALAKGRTPTATGGEATT